LTRPVRIFSGRLSDVHEYLVRPFCLREQTHHLLIVAESINRMVSSFENPPENSNSARDRSYTSASK